MLALLIVATVMLAWHSSRAGVRAVTDEIPVDPTRVAQGLNRIDPNTASPASLRRIPGIGPAKAQAIVEWRVQHPSQPFRQAADLKQVHGIGPVLSARMAPFLSLGRSAAPDDDDDSSWQEQPPPP